MEIPVFQIPSATDILSLNQIHPVIRRSFMSPPYCGSIRDDSSPFSCGWVIDGGAPRRIAIYYPLNPKSSCHPESDARRTRYLLIIKLI